MDVLEGYCALNKDDSEMWITPACEQRIAQGEVTCIG